MIEKSIILTPYNVLLAVASNIPVVLMTGFVVQGHIYHIVQYIILDAIFNDT